MVYAATGHRAFPGGTTLATVDRVLGSPPDLDGVPARLRPVLERCLDKDPGRSPPAGPDPGGETGGRTPPAQETGPAGGGPEPDRHTDPHHPDCAAVDPGGCEADPGSCPEPEPGEGAGGVGGGTATGGAQEGADAETP